LTFKDASIEVSRANITLVVAGGAAFAPPEKYGPKNIKMMENAGSGK